MSEATDGLFEQFGGAERLSQIVHDMYDRVLSDPELAPFFKDVDLTRLHRMQYQFLASALDGPADYTGAELTAIHRGRGITSHHFAIFCGHFADAAESHGVGNASIDAALGRLAVYKDRVIGDVSIDG
jgi:hemoglobin